MEVNDMKKLCKKCGIQKDISEFYKHPQMKDGYLNICISCKLLDASEYRKTNIEKIRAHDRNRQNHNERVTANRKRGNKNHIEAVRNFRQKYPEKARAYMTVYNAIKQGIIVKKDNCEKCGSDYKVSAHHEDYEKPLEIIWLCDTCHKKVHKELRELLRGNA
jgi:ribosomal protein S27AE